MSGRPSEAGTGPACASKRAPLNNGIVAEFRGGAFLALFLGALALAPAAALAQPAGAAAAAVDEEARLLFEAGRRAFDDGRFEDALARFREAYRLTGRPQLLYNIGHTADRMRLDAEAIEAFEAYLAALPDAENRREVEGRIASLRRVVATATPTTESASAAAATATSETSSTPADEEEAPITPPSETAAALVSASPTVETEHPLWAGVLALGGVAAAAAGAIPGAMVLGTRSELDGLCSADGACPESAQSLLDRGQAEATAADVLFAAGGALAVGFGLVWLLVEEPAQTPVTASAWCDPTGCRALAGGRF
jgi:tetratricopeptide (TPR) repeat protein